MLKQAISICCFVAGCVLALIGAVGGNYILAGIGLLVVVASVGGTGL